MAYQRINWEDSPSINTPVNASNLNVMDKGISDLDTNKADKTDLNSKSNTTRWDNGNVTLIYMSSDGPMVTVSTSRDLTLTNSIGQKIRYTQGGVIKHGFIHGLTTTTALIYGGTDYTLTNATISDVYFSTQKAPFGFPLSPAKWTEKFVATSDFTQTNPVQNQWYNAYSKSIPVGAWKLGFSGVAAAIATAAVTSVRVSATLSTTNNSESDIELTGYQGINGASGALLCIASLNIQKDIILTAKTTYYLNIRTVSTTISTLTTAVANQPIIIKAVCAYL